MSQTAQKIPLVHAEAIAARETLLLSTACERIEIVGSVRRKKQAVGDIELLAIPMMQGDLFGQPDYSLLDDRLQELITGGHLSLGPRNGERTKTLVINTGPHAGAKLDLFITTRDRWGMEMVIKTGPEQFSRKIVTQRRFGGLLPDGWRIGAGEGRREHAWKIFRPVQGAMSAVAVCSGQAVVIDGWAYTTIPAPEERDVFEAICMDWIDPEDRGSIS